MNTIIIYREGLQITGELSNEDFTRLFTKFQGAQHLTLEEAQEVQECMHNQRIVARERAIAVTWKLGEA